MKPTLALVILAKNQRSDVEEILNEVGSSFDAVYVLDDNSHDTVSKVPGAKVFTHSLSDSFAEHRNWILTKVHEDWTFFLDADERIPEKLTHEIRVGINNPNVMAFAVPRLDVYGNKTLQHGEVGSILLIRLAQTQKGQGRWKRAVHEYWSFPKNKVATLKTPLLHYAHKDVASFLVKLHGYAVREKSERGKRGTNQILFEIFTYPVAKFIFNYFLKRGFLDGRPGFVYAFCMSYYSLIKRIFWYEDLVS